MNSSCFLWHCPSTNYSLIVGKWMDSLLAFILFHHVIREEFFYFLQSNLKCINFFKCMMYFKVFIMYINNFSKFLKNLTQYYLVPNLLGYYGMWILWYRLHGYKICCCQILEATKWYCKFFKWQLYAKHNFKNWYWQVQESRKLDTTRNTS